MISDKNTICAWVQTFYKIGGNDSTGSIKIIKYVGI